MALFPAALKQTSEVDATKSAEALFSTTGVNLSHDVWHNVLTWTTELVPATPLRSLHTIYTSWVAPLDRQHYAITVIMQSSSLASVNLLHSGLVVWTHTASSLDDLFVPLLTWLASHCRKHHADLVPTIEKIRYQDLARAFMDFQSGWLRSRRRTIASQVYQRRLHADPHYYEW